MINIKEAYRCVRNGNVSTAPNKRDRVVCSRKCKVSIAWCGYSAVWRSPLYVLRTWYMYGPHDWHCATSAGPRLSVNGWSWVLVGAFPLRGRFCFEKAKSVASTARGSSPDLLNPLAIQMIPHDVVTHWNSMYDMLIFMLKYCKAIDKISEDKKMRKYELEEEEWDLVQQL